ncbi:MAG: hypothetical protein N2235_02465 [Fischerella sp.]|nr:hypothetical protein [Fischerella sp.]
MPKIKVNNKTIVAKVKATKNPLFGDEKYTGPEPIWSEADAKLPEEQFQSKLRQALYYYGYYFTVKETKKYVVEWLKANTKMTASELQVFAKKADKMFPMTGCSLILAHKAGMPLSEKTKEWLLREVKACMDSTTLQEYIDEQKEEDKSQITVKPNIQDRLAEKQAELIGELEGLYDELIQGREVEPGTYAMFHSRSVGAVTAKKVGEWFARRRAELEQAQEGKDPQLKEAYSHLKAKDYKRFYAFLNKIDADVAAYTTVKKAAKKVRAPRPMDKAKQVSKMKYLKEDKPLKLVSVNPVDIIGAQELWVYNVKYRKLGRYVADSHVGHLGVKGTSVVGFDTVKSVCKTVRKPEEVLTAFRKATKAQLRKFLDDIKAVEQRLNGRISNEIILLKVQ